MTAADAHHSIWWRLYHGETAFDFMGTKTRWFMVSGLVILIGLTALLTRGLNFGIDFKGGTAWEVKAPGVSVAKARDAVRSQGIGEAKIQVVGGDTVRVEADQQCGDLARHPDRATKCGAVATKLGELGKTTADKVSINTVGPSWGNEITKKAERALVVFFLLIFAYIALRFEWKMAIAAIVAVIHDIVITVGIYALSGFQVTPATVVAFLTILGYSLYDTIVVFDKIEENTRGLAASGRLTYEDTVNLSMNQVLMRSLNTSLVAILPVLSVLIIGAYVLGATALEDFGLALSIGLLTGAYSSIFIASPLLAILKEREPRYASIRQRVLAKGGVAPLTPAAAAAGGLTVTGGAGSGTGGAGSRAAGRSAVAVEDPPDSGAILKPGGGGGGGGGTQSSGRPGGSGGSRPAAKKPPPRPRKKGKRR